MKNTLTLIVGGLLTLAPQFMPFIPQPYAAAATGLLGFLTGLYHLYQAPAA